MKKLLLFLSLFPSIILTQAQDTFSIVAVDTITGEIGSAGASCIGGSIIISDIIPGRGAIHTQSYWSSTNQQNAHERMLEGMSPQEIIDWLVANDVTNNPGRRQYGIVDFDSSGQARSAAFTGANCLDYKNHITGPNYAIQGNILLGQQILDSMEARFLNTEGSFPEKMMAALQGANVPGADTRCLDDGTSSLSAFIRIARPNDTIGSFYCDLNVPSVPDGAEPIDSLQTLFDAWFSTTVGIGESLQETAVLIYPNPASACFTVSSQWPAAFNQKELNVSIDIYSIYGQKMERTRLRSPGQWEEVYDIQYYPRGIYFVTIRTGGKHSISKKLIVE